MQHADDIQIEPVSSKRFDIEHATEIGMQGYGIPDFLK